MEVSIPVFFYFATVWLVLKLFFIKSSLCQNKMLQILLFDTLFHETARTFAHFTYTLKLRMK
jgi:hypothetical protein